MCPSYRATGEERYSTRGRGRLLNEMLRGEVITDGWQSEDVREALDWCLGCKGCRSDCPTHTDMAAYKAEFLSHYHETKARPLASQTMARIGEWAPLGSQASWILNGLSAVIRPPGIASQRSLPRFKKSFRSTFAPGGPQGERVVLFDDTFNNHFRPQTARAAQKLLESAGCAVELPREHLCCGRPYYDYGMLDRARATLDRVLDVLEPGVPVVVLEPGCLSVFRDELKQLFPGDARAARLRMFSLSEFLLARNFRPRSDASVVVHSHCHQKAIWGAGSDIDLLKAAGCSVSAPDTGCCGMSGSFGYKPQHYEASKRIFGLGVERALVAAPTSSVVACGFSCREQIEDLSGRPTLHLAELLAG
jgi:Fe-S oxidoreductase